VVEKDIKRWEGIESSGEAKEAVGRDRTRWGGIESSGE